MYYYIDFNIMDQKIQIGYFSFRGLAQISRLLLAYTGANW